MNIETIRSKDTKIVTIGSHHPIIQSILDFDFLSGKSTPSILGIIATGRKFERYFFGNKEIFIPVFNSLDAIPEETRNTTLYFLNLSSGRRALSSTREFVKKFPNLLGGSVFAEDVPEEHALELKKIAKENKFEFISGPASVGVLLPGVLKLGAIGGTQANQLIGAGAMDSGSVAVFSASGGMVNEIINIVASSGFSLSFAVHFGGDRFPTLSPAEALLAAEKDPETKAVVYYGELGGFDEYEFVDLINQGKVTKPIVCYIAGVVSDLFEEAPQFGHAKAMAGSKNEGAREKREALKKAGVQVGESFSDFVQLIRELKQGKKHEERDYSTILSNMGNRKSALFASSISHDVAGDVKILGEDLTKFTSENSFAKIAASLFLGKKIVSPDMEKFVDLILRISVDHGPYVSGAVNTMITARAGRDLVSSLAAGLLTIGPRFGGAVNEAAKNWLTGVSGNIEPNVFVEDFASKKIYIQGIGHKKYRIDLPDPRVAELKKQAEGLSKKRFLSYALEIEKITSGKKGNLILNVDGTIAAVLLDILSEKEGYSDEGLLELVNQEFFNALFVLSRSVGFIAHYLDQKRLDEGLFRLSEDQVADAS